MDCLSFFTNHHNLLEGEEKYNELFDTIYAVLLIIYYSL